MPLFDKVKAQASQLAQKAQEAGKVGQTKMEDASARRRADGLLHELGVAAYAERSGGPTDDTRREIERLVSDLSAYESEHGPLSANVTADPNERIEGDSNGADTMDPKDGRDETEQLPDGGFTL